MASLQRSTSTSSELNDFTETPDGRKIYIASKSRLISLVNWFSVLGVYLPLFSLLLVAVLTLQIAVQLYSHRFDVHKFVTEEMVVVQLSKPFAFNLGWQTMAILAIVAWRVYHREKRVYLLDFATFDAPDSWKVSQEQIVEILRLQGCYTEEGLRFMDRMLKQSGTGNATAWPPGIVSCLHGHPQDKSIEASRKEAEVVMFDCVRRLLAATNCKARDIDVLVVNCSLFSPTPSLCAMVINEFGLRPDISSYNLSGMGCSASLISVELVKNILAGRPHTTALIVSTEIITPNLYYGDDRSFLLQNTLFRCGGAAVLLSNKWTDALRARFKLLKVIRTQYVGEDSFGCVYETEDSNHRRGVRLSKDIVKTAGRAMEKNFTALGPYVLPLSEQARTVFSMLWKTLSKQLGLPKVTLYMPDFKRGIDHFCIHAGGRGVIDGIEKNLNLSPRHVEASRHTLFKYGNTSSSSIWYELEYVRTRMGLKRGQRVLQLAFGSGFKCNSAVWLCLNNERSKASNLAEEDELASDVRKND